MLTFPAKYGRTAREVKHHYRLACGKQGLEQAALGIGQRNIAAARRFAAEFRRLAQSGYNDIARTGHAQSFGQQLLLGTFVAHLAAEHGGVCLKFGIGGKVRAFGVDYSGTVAHGIAHTFIESFVFFGCGGHAPCAGHVGAGVSKRTNYGYATAFLQR